MKGHKVLVSIIVFVSLILGGLAGIVAYAAFHPDEDFTTYTVEIPVDCPAEDDCLFQEGRVLQPDGTVHYVVTVTRIEH